MRFILTLFGILKSNLHQQSFVERGGIDSGFADYYEKKIKPNYIKIEKIRLKSLRSFFLTIGVIVLFFMSRHWLNSKLNLEWLSDLIGKDGEEIISGFLHQFILLLFVALIFFLTSIEHGFRYKVKSSLYQDLIGFFEGFEFYQNASIKNWKLDKAGLVINYEILDPESLIVGKYLGVELSFAECRKKTKRYIFFISKAYRKALFNSLRAMFKDKNTKKDQTIIFNGTIMMFEFNKSFKGRTLLKIGHSAVDEFFNQKKKQINNFFSNNKEYSDDNEALSLVSLEDPEFEKIFEVFSSDQIEARYLLTTSFMERIKKLNRCEACFYENKLFLVFRNSDENPFKIGSMFREINLTEECVKFLNQMHVIFEIVEVLKLNEKTGL